MTAHGSPAWPWLALFLLGAYHGANPGMGWLFAVALGLQEKSARAVLRCLAPLGLGHLISIGLVVGLVELVQDHLSHLALRLAVATILFVFGVYRFFRSRHPRWVGMQVGFRDLTLWSFLMASAHGAGLMLAPIILGWPQMARGDPMPQMAMPLPAAPMDGASRFTSWMLPVGMHTLGYLLITGVLAFVVYQRVGLAILRRAWFNLDLVWSVALVGTGILTLFV